ncbi:MAG: alkaline phosphatase D family protein, partial [Marinirhabdus sp.]
TLPLFLLFPTLLYNCGTPAQQAKGTAKTAPEAIYAESAAGEIAVVFASCNDQDRPQPLWKAILQNRPDLFIWGGDNVYADTADMQKMEADYQKIADNPDYNALKKSTKIIGTWDDHDYGKNDAGREWEHKDAAKNILLNFLGTPKNAPVRYRPGVYDTHTVQTAHGSIKFILLDTRYFRAPLKKSAKEGMRYEPWPEAESGTILGEAQWQWLQDELEDSAPTFTVIVSSIQFLNNNHGWEKWGNHPTEVKKMEQVLARAKANNIMFLSGDRHMAEFSVAKLETLPYPLIDFTTSGLTHTWPTYATEENKYRASNVVKQLNFGVLKFNLKTKAVTFQIRGAGNFLYEEMVQQY